MAQAIHFQAVVDHTAAVSSLQMESCDAVVARTRSSKYPLLAGEANVPQARFVTSASASVFVSFSSAWGQKFTKKNLHFCIHPYSYSILNSFLALLFK